MKIRCLALFFIAAAHLACRSAGQVRPETKPSAGGPYDCTRIMGVAIVHEWFDHGFETYVDGARWEEQAKHGQYLERWRDPNDPVWNEPIVSACAQKSGNPDRILFQAVNWSYTTSDEWVADLMKIMPLLQAKFSNLRRIELFTLSRSPGNLPCANSDPKAMVKPHVDDALIRVAAAFPDLVTISKPVHTPSCDVYKPGSPHWTPEAYPTMARIYGLHYAQNQ